MPATPAPGALTTMVGGVGELFQGDLDLGRVVIDRLHERDLPTGVVVEDLHYGAIAVAQRLQELRPDGLVLVGAKQRGREPGTLHRRRVADLDLTTDEVQTSVSDAGVGYVDVDLVVDVAWGLQALPGRTIVLEVEPVDVAPGEGLSASVAAVVPDVLAAILDEVDLMPLFDLVGRLQARLADGHLDRSPVREAMVGVVGELARFDDDGQWGRTFTHKERLKLAIANGAASQGMDQVDWAMTWALVEELDRQTHRSLTGLA